MLEWIASLIEGSGYLGIAALMLAENVFPPIPSEIIMPLAGYSAARGALNPFGAIVAGSIGSLAGAFLWFIVGYKLGIERLKRFAGRHGRWLTLTPSDIDEAHRWFERYGRRAVLFGRLVPGVRTLISVPAGVACMDVVSFAAYSFVGTVAWTAFLTGAGFVLGENYQEVSDIVQPLGNVVMVVLVTVYLYRVATFKRRIQSQDTRNSD